MAAHKIAQGLAALGRGEDSMLVHMTPHEVAGLQKIAIDHGGSLTINPHTGLPEAGFLKSILPAIAGIGLSALFPMASPWLIGGGVGLGTKLAGGSMTDALLAGLSGGMAGSAATKLAGLGAKAAGEKLTEEAAKGVTGQFLKNAGQEAATRGLTSYLGNIASGLGQLGTTGSPAAMTALGGKLGLGALAAPMLYEASKPPKFKMPDQAKGGKFKYYTTRYNPGVYNPEAGFGESPFTGQGFEEGQYSEQYPGYADGGTVAPTPVSAITDYLTQLNQSFKPVARPAAPVAPAPVAPVPTTPTVPGLPAGFDPSKLPAFNFMGVNLAGLLGKYGAEGGAYKYDPATQRFTASTPTWNKTEPKTYAAGGQLLSGGGDGMSDSIPAMIDGPKPQRARLADGEFVVPADVVSHLGNGSTKAGANQLYAMMDKVRRARTGKAEQAPAINPNKFLA